MQYGEMAGAGLSWFLETFVSPFVAQLGGAAKSQWRQVNWPKAEDDYKRQIRKLHGRIRVLGRPEELSLRDEQDRRGIYTDLFILDKPTAMLRYSINELRGRGTDRFQIRWNPRQSRVDGLKFIRENGNLFILGKPGAGKTTFLKNVALESITDQTQRVPILVSLHEWSMSSFEELRPFITSQFEVCNFPDPDPFVEHILENGRAIVMFDGLDEVRHEEGKRRLLVRQLQLFAQRYGLCQHLITCRVAANEYSFTGFRDVEIADFDTDQITQFARRWFARNESTYESFSTTIIKPENSGVLELCTSPLLLSMLCLAYEETRELSHFRAQLYKDAIEALLRRWDASRNIERDHIYRNLTENRKQQLFSYIAILTFENGEYFINEEQLLNFISTFMGSMDPSFHDSNIDAYAILRAIEAQHAVLVERSHKIHSFAHLTFHEYFTARYVIENEARGTTRRLMANLPDSRWREVFLLCVSMSSEATDFLENMAEAVRRRATDLPLLSDLLNWANKGFHYPETTDTQRIVSRSSRLLMANTVIRVPRIDKYPPTTNIDYSITRSRSLDILVELVDKISPIVARIFSQIRTLDLKRAIAIDNAIDIAKVLALPLDETLNREMFFARVLDDDELRLRILSRADHAVIDDIQHSADRQRSAYFASAVDRAEELGNELEDHVLEELRSAAGIDAAETIGMILLWQFAEVVRYAPRIVLTKSPNLTKRIVQIISKLIHQQSILEDLRQITPKDNDDMVTWESFASRLAKLADTHWGIERYAESLATSSAPDFNRYLIASNLYLDCLRSGLTARRSELMGRLFNSSQIKAKWNSTEIQ